MGLFDSLAGGSSQESSRRDFQGVAPNPEMLSWLDRTIGRPPSIQEWWSMLPQGHSLFGGYNRPAGGITVGRENLQQSPGAAQGPAKFTMEDIGSSYNQDPEKLMDIQRLFRTGHLDPQGFTLDDLSHAIGKADWASGRSKGNFTRLLADLTARNRVFSDYQINRFAPPPLFTIPSGVDTIPQYGMPPLV